MRKCLTLQSKMILYVAIGALFAFMGGIVYYSTFDLPELEKSEIELYSVEVIEVNNFENYISLKTTFLIKNLVRRQLLFRSFRTSFLPMENLLEHPTFQQRTYR